MGGRVRGFSQADFLSSEGLDLLTCQILCPIGTAKSVFCFLISIFLGNLVRGRVEPVL